MPLTILPGTIPDGAVDVVFTSNFFEHLPDKDMLSDAPGAVHRVLKPNGTLIAMGPNIKYVPAAYWDFIGHHLPLTELSLAEALHIAGLEATTIIPRFLSYATQSSLPQAPIFVKLFLKFPLAWRFLGKQFLVVSRKLS